jgi:hypothetical protein
VAESQEEALIRGMALALFHRFEQEMRHGPKHTKE